MPEHHVGELYRLSESKRDRLARAGVTTIANIPAKFALTETQERQRRAVLAGGDHVNIGELRGSRHTDKSVLTWQAERDPLAALSQDPDPSG